jgi:hypothetical protein
MEALKRMGMTLRPNEFKLVKDHLDSANTGYLKYQELVGHIEGIPQWRFINDSVKLLARFVDDGEHTLEQFKLIVDPKSDVRLSLASLKLNLSRQSSSTFAFTDMNTEEVFRSLAKGSDKGVVLVSEVLDKVFQAVEALAIERMQHKLMSSEKQLIDLLHQHAAKKNGMMEYIEVENLMTSL